MEWCCRSHNALIEYPTRGRSYEVQHEDFHNTDVPNRFKTYGALVGGPQSDDRCCHCSIFLIPKHGLKLSASLKINASAFSALSPNLQGFFAVAAATKLSAGHDSACWQSIQTFQACL